jgi:proteasome lid subunit RPN8/RPN11
MSLQLAPSLHEQITQHLAACYPNEGGGFLIGRLLGPDRYASEIRIEVNQFATEEQYHRYLMEQGAFQAAEDDADSRGLTLLGYFHSHPDSPAIPSEYDRVHALPNFAYLIVSIRGGQPAESLVWELAPDRERFNPLPLIIE